MARRFGRGAHARGGHPPRDRGGAARFPPPRAGRAAVVRAAARAERRDPVPPGGVPRRALAGPRRLRPFRAAGVLRARLAGGAADRGRLRGGRRFRGRGLLLAHPGAELARAERRHRARRRRRRDGCTARHAGAGSRRHASASGARTQRARRRPVSRQHRGPPLARAGGLGGGADRGQHRAAAVIKALAFDVFGTVVDWRGAVIREGELLAKEKGLRVDWPRFADAWRAGYHPAMDRVRKGKLPWTRIDQLHRMILNDLLKPFGLGGLMMVAAHPRDLEAAQRAGLKTAYVPRPLEYGLDGRQETGPHAVFDVTAGDFLDLAVKLGA